MNYTKLSHAEYRELSARTVSPNFWVTSEMNLVTESGRLQELHMAMGLVTEVQELMLAVLKPDGEERIVNIGEEICDAMWYIAGLERLYGIDLSTCQPRLSLHTPMNLVTDLIVDSVEILDMYKKCLFYNKNLNLAHLYTRLNSAMSTLETLAIDFDLQTSVLKAKNINKLYVRFPEKFTNVNAQERNLSAEYEALR